MLVSLRQDQKALGPISVTEEGISMCVKPELWNARSPILSTEEGISISVRPEQPSKA